MPKYESWMSHKRVEGTGPMDARIVLIGEAPGVSEVQYGAPFVGASGQRLFGGGGFGGDVGHGVETGLGVRDFAQDGFEAEGLVEGQVGDGASEGAFGSL